MKCFPEERLLKGWRVLKRRYLLKRWWMNIRVDHVQLPSGKELPEFHVIEYPDWACVLCITTDHRVVLVRQYRHALGAITYELPAGAINTGEPPLEAARRELLEETGYASEHWTLLGRCAPEPSKHAHFAHLFIAKEAEQVQQPAYDDSEDIQYCLVSVQELLRMANTGQIMHGVHLATIFWAVYRGVLR